jgi:hypothetical protein
MEHPGDRKVIRIGYDLLEEVRLLLTQGQPVGQAAVPTLDLHVALLRGFILGAGIPLLEIPPVPAGHKFAICLTHDIDFVGIRRHGIDHSTVGFLYRSTFGAIHGLVRGRLSIRRVLKMWRAALAWPFVLLGLRSDFWEPFEWYLRVEKNLPATYYVIPYKRRRGDRVGGGRPSARRATAYDVSDLGEWSDRLVNAQCEIGVHGIDAWHSIGHARDERSRVAKFTHTPVAGIRIHWLLRNSDTAAVLDEAGYLYDSTFGYNETVGFRNGTTQVFRPIGVHQLLEVPMHIQDGALFFPDRLDLTESDAWARCTRILEHARQAGGVLTVLWHDRSHGPERFWGDFYVRLVAGLKATDGWFATAGDVARWFNRRRSVRFEQSADGNSYSISSDGEEIHPPLTIRLHRPIGEQYAGAQRVDTVDAPWNGRPGLDLTRNLELTTRPVGLPSPV